MSLDRAVTPDYSIQLINDKNTQVYLNLAHCYEAEFSPLTHKTPNEAGLFEPDTLPESPYKGYLLYKNKTPLGFCMIELSEKKNDMAEFYIVPAARKNKLGDYLATEIFDMHPGHWQVRQITGADHAKAFWRKVIASYTQNKYTENTISDPDWGVVTCQTFETSPKLTKKHINTNDLLHTHSLFPFNPITTKSAVADPIQPTAQPM